MSKEEEAEKERPTDQRLNRKSKIHLPPFFFSLGVSIGLKETFKKKLGVHNITTKRNYRSAKLFCT